MAVDDWDRRVLCPDDACIGVIGPDGTCKVCGHAAPNWGDERNRGLTPTPPDSPTESDDDEVATEASDPAAPDGDAADPNWQERKLCIDDACIGLIGDDGACKVCGKRAVAAVEASDEADEDDDDDAKAADAEA